MFFLASASAVILLMAFELKFERWGSNMINFPKFHQLNTNLQTRRDLKKNQQHILGDSVLKQII